MLKKSLLGALVQLKDLEGGAGSQRSASARFSVQVCCAPRPLRASRGSRRAGSREGLRVTPPSPAESCATATTMPPGSLPFWQSLAVTAYNRRTSSLCSRYCHISQGRGTELLAWRLLYFHGIKCLPRTSRPLVWTAPGWGSFWSETEISFLSA